MATTRDVCVISLAGNSMVELKSVNLSDTTGVVLRQMVAKAVGFPAVGIKLLNAGACLPDETSVEAALGQDACSSSSTVSLTCVLEPSKPAGPKTPGRRRGGSFGSKAGMILSRRLASERRKVEQGTGVFECLRVPDPEMQQQALHLIASSFDEGLAELISMGIAAAYSSASRAEASPQPPCVYEDAELGAYADLSSCQLWMKVVNPTIQSEMSDWLHKDATEIRRVSPLACAVLWRMLDAPAASQDGKQTSGRPVLEVLFLATSPDLQEMGQAQELMQELEEAAQTMGCYAICVAVVAMQGISFWTRCGYEVVVPLEKTALGTELGEPCSALGTFLLEKMLLFTDTPLVAKVL